MDSFRLMKSAGSKSKVSESKRQEAFPLCKAQHDINRNIHLKAKINVVLCDVFVSSSVNESKKHHYR